MAKFKNTNTGVVVSVDDAKADRFAAGWEQVDTSATKKAAREDTPKASTKSDK